MRRLYEGLVGPLAQKRTRGAFYRNWRVVSLDGSTLDVADEAANEQAYGRPRASRGRSAFPKIRFTALVEAKQLFFCNLTESDLRSDSPVV